jgi:hypothetical protein
LGTSVRYWASTRSRPLVGAEPGRLEVEPIAGAGAADAVERLLGDDLLTAGEEDLHPGPALVPDGLHPAHLLAEAEGDAALAQVVGERVGHFGVDECQEARALVDERHPHPQRGEDAGVLAPDHPRAHYRQGAGEVLESDDVVAGEDVLPVEGDVRVARSVGAGCHHDHLGADVVVPVAVGVGQSQRVRAREGCLGGEDLYPVAHELVAGHVDLMADHVVGAEEQVLHRDVLLDAVRGAVEPLLPVAGEVDHRLAQRLAGDGAGVDAHPAHHRHPLHQPDALAQLGPLDRRALARGAGSDDQQIVVEARHLASEDAMLYKPAPRAALTGPKG